MPEKPEERRPPKWLIGPISKIVMFHDKEVPVFAGTAPIDKIKLWRDNDRTLLDLDHLADEMEKPLDQISDDEIIDYVLAQGLHKIPDLAKSIRKNGVRVPLTITPDGRLLDGNRRFLACKFLQKTSKSMDPKFTEVPVQCIRDQVSSETELKIIAEMNFLEDYREKWTRYVRAKFAIRTFEKFNKELKDEDAAYAKVAYLLEINRSDLNRFEQVLQLIDDFVVYATEKAKKTEANAENYGRIHFHFFEEFYNKALIGKSALKESGLRNEAVELLYRYLLNQQLRSTTGIRDFAELVRHDRIRKELRSSTGSVARAKSVYHEFMLPKKTELKVSDFCDWVEGLSTHEKSMISEELRKRLLQIARTLSGLRVNQ